jgi:4-amino-4-deoxy-L-arabinose transferase-like glycosyltransferase
VPALISIFFAAAFTVASAYAWGALALGRTSAPWEVALAVGAVIESLLVFVILLCGAGGWPVYLGLGAVPLAALVWFRRPSARVPIGIATLSLTSLLPFAAFLVYGVWYLVNAFAPETWPDGFTYHLGLAADYARGGAFPPRITFYDMLPQAMEMLFTVAFSFGRHSAAKLVEFALFAATPSLIFRIAQRLGLSYTGALLGAGAYFFAPVAGLTGSSSYNDAALVFFALASFYLLLEWRDAAPGTGGAYPIAAGLTAGFCYAIKMPGAVVVLAAALFVIGQRRWSSLWRLAVGAALPIAPWMVRAAVLTGNPLAPLANRLFPNPFFHIATENELASHLTSLGTLKWWGVPWELAFGDRLVGTFGPLLWLLPLALLAWRSRSGRLCLAAALLLATPWLTNHGARFLMPAVVFGWLALGLALPRRIALAAFWLQAALCWPQLLNAFQPAWTFRLHEFPLRAALRIEPESHYLATHTTEYATAKMIEAHTPPGARVLALAAVANAYLDRDVRVSWQSAECDLLIDMFHLAAHTATDYFYNWRFAFPSQSLRGIQLRIPAGYPNEWDVDEVEFHSNGERIESSPTWTLRAKPNVWEAPLAIDGLALTRWRTWQPLRRGMFLEVDFDRPRTIDDAVVLSHTPALGVSLDCWGLGPDFHWKKFAPGVATLRRPEDWRFELARLLKRAGYRYVMSPVGDTGNGPLGRMILSRPLEWNMTVEGRAGNDVLFRVR